MLYYDRKSTLQHLKSNKAYDNYFTLKDCYQIFFIHLLNVHSMPYTDLILVTTPLQVAVCLDDICQTDPLQHALAQCHRASLPAFGQLVLHRQQSHFVCRLTLMAQAVQRYAENNEK